MEKRDDANWATPSIKEWIFYRDDMTPEEFEEEYENFWKYASEGRLNEYKPLYKQIHSEVQITK